MVPHYPKTGTIRLEKAFKKIFLKFSLNHTQCNNRYSKLFLYLLTLFPTLLITFPFYLFNLYYKPLILAYVIE